MAIAIIPQNRQAGIIDMPNGFWNAFFVETPIAKLFGCEYTDRGIVAFEHGGYDGELFSEHDALAMHDALSKFVQTEEYTNHRYFASRMHQIDAMLKFLPLCGGFKKDW